jgi:hypothetical protein
MILFDESNHTYVNSDTGEFYDSVTTVIGKYKTPFDSVKIGTKFLEKNSHRIGSDEFAIELITKYNLDISVEEFWLTPLTLDRLLGYWQYAGDYGRRRGNAYHFQKEYETMYIETKLQEDYNDFVVDLSFLDDGVYPELRLFHHGYRIAGTADKVVIERPYFDMLDYKTMKKPITKANYGKFMKLPISFIPDANYYHYMIQLNIYAWILVQSGFKPRKMELVHKRWMDHEVIPDKERDFTITEKKQKEPLHIPYTYDMTLAPLILNHYRNE